MKVFQVSDCDWWMAETAEQARDSAVECYGADLDDFPLDEIDELSDDQMQSLKFYDEDENVTRTFAEQLSRRIREGATKPEIFASTEY
jgi:hypothetical protein